MRTLILSCALLVFALPGAAAARPGAQGDGTLLIKDGIGRVSLVARGGVIGHIGEGILTVRDPNPDDWLSEVVTGAERTRPVSEFVTKYWGKDLRFRYIGGRFAISIMGSDVDLSAIGKGVVTIAGKGTADDGTFSINGATPQPLPGPFFPTTFQLSANAG